VNAPAPARTRIDAWLRKRFALRIHMTLILAATFAVGLLMARLLADVHIARMWVRYMLAVVAAYAAFLVFIRIWLYYLGICARRDRSRNILDVGDLTDAFCNLGTTPIELFSFSNESANSVGGNWSSGASSFGGGGAGGSWGEPEPSVAVPNVSGGLDFDFDEGWIFILLIVVVLSILTAGIYMVWAAPAIFGETAFHAALAAALIKKTKEMHEPGWVGSVMKSTALPFAFVLAATIALGVVAQKHCPSAMRLRDAFSCAPVR
jgi:hypothetical protein